MKTAILTVIFLHLATATVATPLDQAKKLSDEQTSIFLGCLENLDIRKVRAIQEVYDLCGTARNSEFSPYLRITGTNSKGNPMISGDVGALLNLYPKRELRFRRHKEYEYISIASQKLPSDEFFSENFGGFYHYIGLNQRDVFGRWNTPTSIRCTKHTTNFTCVEYRDLCQNITTWTSFLNAWSKNRRVQLIISYPLDYLTIWPSFAKHIDDFIDSFDCETVQETEDRVTQQKRDEGILPNQN